jgi:hypothetical protein
MNIYSLRDKEGRVFAFEVANTSITRRSVVAIAMSIQEAIVTRKPKFLSWFREEEFCEFQVSGKTFVAWEPYGDNSRYWIGPKPSEWSEQISVVRDAFEKYKPLLGLSQN